MSADQCDVSQLDAAVEVPSLLSELRCKSLPILDERRLFSGDDVFYSGMRPDRERSRSAPSRLFQLVGGNVEEPFFDRHNMELQKLSLKQNNRIEQRERRAEQRQGLKPTSCYDGCFSFFK